MEDMQPYTPTVSGVMPTLHAGMHKQEIDSQPRVTRDRVPARCRKGEAKRVTEVDRQSGQAVESGVQMWTGENSMPNDFLA